MQAPLSSPAASWPPDEPARSIEASPARTEGGFPDILLPLGPGSRWQNNELRYCLRSIEKFAKGYRNIVVVTSGQQPAVSSQQSLRIEPYPETLRTNKEARITYKLLWAFKNIPHLTENVILFNDDYLLTRPIDFSAASPSPLPNYHRGPLTEAIRTQSCPIYRQALAATHMALSQAGHPVLHYDVHLPILINRPKFISLETPWWQTSLNSKHGLLLKSIYCNIPATPPAPTFSPTLTPPPAQIHDCKLRWFNPKTIDSLIADRFLFSYSDHALDTGLKPWIESHYPTKSKWET